MASPLVSRLKSRARTTSSNRNGLVGLIETAPVTAVVTPDGARPAAINRATFAVRAAFGQVIVEVDVLEQMAKRFSIRYGPAGFSAVKLKSPPVEIVSIRYLLSLISAPYLNVWLP